MFCAIVNICLTRNPIYVGLYILSFILYIIEMKSPVFSIILVLGLIGLIVHEAFEINGILTNLKQTSELKSKPKPRVKVQRPEPQNLEKACEEIRNETEKCLDDAQACLKVLNTFTEKNKLFEKKVQQCQQRNNKNSDRNNRLKDRLDSVSSRMNKQREGVEQMEL